MRCLSFFINKHILGNPFLCSHVPKVPYGSYAPEYRKLKNDDLSNRDVKV